MNTVQNNPTGLLYRIKDGEQTKGYLYGTTHVNLNQDPEFGVSQKAMKCFQKSSDLVVEYNVFNHPKFKNFGATQKEIALRINEKLPKTQIGQDLELLMLATNKDLKILDLETCEIQDEALQTYKMEYGKTFRKLIQYPAIESQATPEEKAWKKEFDEISALKDIIWKTSDETIIERVAKYGCSPEFYKKFNDERNMNMTNKLDTILQGDGRHFAPIGAGHVVGDTGIANLLRDKGWTVEKV